ncbi:DUF952 domain-containing protein [Micromonospora halophytica]|uniref:Uncharacterized conserved protein, DUF952 family n=1 Tax=Micromonospora halophytica TaxID=47864 RepID=A0A1C5IR33_9ACTN|nr:DUF952 domain-containing protein [Micromonospora halophytica]SCG60774.1 Uncharacterized conserved protein, DUF952 family [Micromonospora halophytica]
MIYKLVPIADWARVAAEQEVPPSALDRQDGFIHLSAQDQIVETARRHYAGATGLVLLAVDAERLGGDLRWEPSRGGALFPHLYGSLPVEAVVGVHELPADVPVADAVADLLG